MAGGGSASSGLQSLDQPRLRDYISIPLYPSVLSPHHGLYSYTMWPLISFHDCICYTLEKSLYKDGYKSFRFTLIPYFHC